MRLFTLAATSARPLLLLAVLLSLPTIGRGQALVAPFNTQYKLTDLGKLPAPIADLYSGLCFDTNTTMLVAGASNSAGSLMYQVTLNRDSAGHITGFAPGPTLYKNSPFIDGGPQEGPTGVLFAACFNTNQMLQWKPTGGLPPDKTILLTPLGVSSSTGGVVFIPAGFPGAGGMRITSFSTSEFYSASFAPDGLGTFNVGPITLVTTIAGGPVDFVYVRPGAPLLGAPKQYMLVSEWSNDTISAYQLDGGGNPIPASRTLFMNIPGPTGAQYDPITGDYVFTTWVAGASKVVRVSYTHTNSSTGEGDFNGVHYNNPGMNNGEGWFLGGGQAPTVGCAPPARTPHEKFAISRAKQNLLHLPTAPYRGSARLLGPFALGSMQTRSPVAKLTQNGPRPDATNQMVFNLGSRANVAAASDGSDSTGVVGYAILVALLGVVGGALLWQRYSAA